jgi:ACT domain-containing protein
MVTRNQIYKYSDSIRRKDDMVNERIFTLSIYFLPEKSQLYEDFLWMARKISAITSSCQPQSDAICNQNLHQMHASKQMPMLSKYQIRY